MSLKHFIELRFIESQFKVLEAFIEDLPALVVELRGMDKSSDPKISSYLRIITGLKFVTICLVELDVDNVLKKLSKRGQSDNGDTLFSTLVTSL